MRFVIDIQTNRVVWFTDSDATLNLTDNTALVDYTGEMPRAMTVQNCWNWCLRDRKLVRLDRPKGQSLADMNREATEKMLRRKINRMRDRHAAGMSFAETISIEAVAAARTYLETGTSHFIVARLAATWGVNMSDAARRIIADAEQLTRWLLHTEAQLHEYLTKIAAAKTDAEVLSLHEAIARL